MRGMQGQREQGPSAGRDRAQGTGGPLRGAFLAGALGQGSGEDGRGGSRHWLEPRGECFPAHGPRGPGANPSVGSPQGWVCWPSDHMLGG